MLSIPQIILRAEISQYLAVIAIKKGGLFGKGTPSFLPELLYQVRKTVARMYALNPDEENLVAMANYLYKTCGIYGIRASYLISSGGVIPNPSPGTTIYSYPLSSQYIAVDDGETDMELRDINNALLPTGTIITWAEKSVVHLNPTDYVFNAPIFTLINGVSMSQNEILSFQYIVPL